MAAPHNYHIGVIELETKVINVIEKNFVKVPTSKPDLLLRAIMFERQRLEGEYNAVFERAESGWHEYYELFQNQDEINEYLNGVKEDIEELLHMERSLKSYLEK